MYVLSFLSFSLNSAFTELNCFPVFNSLECILVLSLARNDMSVGLKSKPALSQHCRVGLCSPQPRTHARSMYGGCMVWQHFPCQITLQLLGGQHRWGLCWHAVLYLSHSCPCLLFLPFWILFRKVHITEVALGGGECVHAWSNLEILKFLNIILVSFQSHSLIYHVYVIHTRLYI